MTDLNTVTEEKLTDALGTEKRSSKPRVSLPRNSGQAGGASANIPARARRQSSRTSIPRAGYDRRLIRYENTYRMEPTNENKVDIGRLRRIATSAIESAVANYKYDPKQGKQFSVGLAELVRSQIKQLPFQRYKCVVQASIGQKQGQDLRVVSRCLWDVKWDRHLTISKETQDAYVTVTIFLVYTE